MKRIKVINDPTELVPMLRAVDTEVKRKVFQRVVNDWCTAQEIEDDFGEDGREALPIFEKMKLVDTMWQSSHDNKQEKAYHTYYMSFHINTSCPVTEISDVLSVAMMDDEKYDTLECDILDMIEKGGRFAGDICEDKDLTQIQLKSVVKRSAKLDMRGHRVLKVEEEGSRFG